jgi:hypothetical protein
MDTDSEFGLPWDPENQDDQNAVETMLLFNFGWYNDPMHFGKYPDIMR